MLKKDESKTFEENLNRENIETSDSSRIGVFLSKMGRHEVIVTYTDHKSKTEMVGSAYNESLSKWHNSFFFSY